jgi:hypothetical protein
MEHLILESLRQWKSLGQKCNKQMEMGSWIISKKSMAADYEGRLEKGND